jgi:hypothetical protein
MEIDTDKIDDAVLALMWLPFMTRIAPGRGSTGRLSGGCMIRG